MKKKILNLFLVLLAFSFISCNNSESLQEKESQHVNKTKKEVLKKSDKVIGTWFVDWGVKYKQTFFFRDKTLFSKTIYSDGSGSIEKMKYKKLNNGAIKVLDVDPYGAYYIITPDKKLEFWGSKGKFYTAEKL